MADDGLAGLSREELLELVRRQQDELAAREAAIERRDEKIRELEEELAQFRQPAKTSENSAVPPSRGQKANRVEGRRRKLGPKRGHPGVSRLRREPDVVVECRPCVCAGCGQGLPQTGGRRVGRSQVIELPTFAPVVIEAWQYTVACEQCGQQTAGSSTTWLRPVRRPPLGGSSSPQPAHARGRHSTTMSGSLRTRLTPTCPRFGPSFRRPATRLGFRAWDGGTDEFSGVFAGCRNCANSSSSSRIFSSRRSIAASRSASASCWRRTSSSSSSRLSPVSPSSVIVPAG